MALGLKKIETRHWATEYTGPVIIHAAKRWTRDEREFWEDYRLEHPELPETLPLGALVAIGTLATIRSTEDLIDRGNLSPLELDWGNYDPHRFGWIFENIVPIKDPIPYKGKQGFFNVPADVHPPYITPRGF